MTSVFPSQSSAFSTISSQESLSSGKFFWMKAMMRAVIQTLLSIFPPLHCSWNTANLSPMIVLIMLSSLKYPAAVWREVSATILSMLVLGIFFILPLPLDKLLDELVLPSLDFDIFFAFVAPRTQRSKQLSSSMSQASSSPEQYMTL